MPGRNRLPRRESLKRHRDILRLLRFGQQMSARGFELKWERSEDFGYALIVSRKHGTAVERNRLKRLYREAIRRHKQVLAKPIRVVILPAATNRRPNPDSIDAEISRIFGLISNQSQ